MADYEGYLLLHGVGRNADPVYFELAGGLLRYFTTQNGKLLGQFSLTRHRVVARAMKSGAATNRFLLDLCPVRSIHDTERSMHQFKRTAIQLSASTPRVMEEWIRAFYMWRRRNWRDGTVISGHADEYRVLRSMMYEHRLEFCLTQEAGLAMRSVTMTPEMDDQGASISKRGMLTPYSRFSFGRWGFGASHSSKAGPAA